MDYTPIPGHCGGFGAIVDRVGRGMPRAVACGKEYTVVATYPYQGQCSRYRSEWNILRPNIRPRISLVPHLNLSSIRAYGGRRTGRLMEERRLRLQEEALQREAEAKLARKLALQAQALEGRIAQVCRVVWDPACFSSSMKPPV